MRITRSYIYPDDVYAAIDDIGVWEDEITALSSWYDDESATPELLIEETRERLPEIAEQYGELETKREHFQRAYDGLLYMNQELGTPIEDSLEAIETFEDRFYDVKREQDRLSGRSALQTNRQVEDYTGTLDRTLTRTKDAIHTADDTDMALAGIGAASLSLLAYGYLRKTVRD